MRIWPRPSPLRNGEQWEEFCRVKVLLHVPHRSIQQIKETDVIAWSTVYEQHIETINREETIDLLGQAIDREEPSIEDEDSGYEVDEDSDQEEAFRYEKSMVGRRMLSLIDLRLRQATPERKDEPFG